MEYGLTLNENFLIVENMMLNAENQLYRLQDDMKNESSDSMLEEEYSYLLDEAEGQKKTSVWEKIKNAIKTALEAIAKFFKTIWNAIVSFFIWLGKKIKAVFNKLRGKTKTVETTLNIKAIMELRNQIAKAKVELKKKDITADEIKEITNRINDLKSQLKGDKKVSVSVDQVQKAIETTANITSETAKEIAASVKNDEKELAQANNKLPSVSNNDTEDKIDATDRSFGESAYFNRIMEQTHAAQAKMISEKALQQTAVELASIMDQFEAIGYNNPGSSDKSIKKSKEYKELAKKASRYTDFDEKEALRRVNAGQLARTYGDETDQPED